ncbi:hypothetical protein P3H15_52290 [Rhodococcus sp. T2V]|uniref:hypothetical protein n=1 Tax=Rhodococcus sp. T2V TaxID=3034164 RepID=UPI0023E32032|nr:hypothetical protein [Rhodococcus sp. T2V]MDF3313482.1 hypothetical protein [Rhodococcus sp. T2V]
MKQRPPVGGGRNGLAGGGLARHLPDADETDPGLASSERKIDTYTRLKGGDVIGYRQKVQARQRAAFDDFLGFED